MEDEKLWKKIESAAKKIEQIVEPGGSSPLFVEMELPELFDKIRSMPEYREYLRILYEHGLYPHVIEELLHGPPEGPLPAVVSRLLGRMEAFVSAGVVGDGIDVRVLRVFLDELRAMRRVVEGGVAVLSLWERGDYVLPALGREDVVVLGIGEELARAGLGHILEVLDRFGSLPPDSLEGVAPDVVERLGIVGEVIRIRDAVRDGRLTIEDARELLKTLHSALSAAENAHAEYLSRMEELSVGEDGSIRAPPEHYRSHVYERLRRHLEQMRPRITKLIKI